MTYDFANRVAVVTGGNSGIGKAVAARFAHAGAQVVVAARRRDEGIQTVEEIKQSGGEAIFVKADMLISSDIEMLVQKTVAEYGRLDYACNNAGIVSGSRLHEIAEEDWDRVIAVNLKGVWLCMKHQIAQMRLQGGGAIVNMSSVGGLVGVDWGIAPYIASKHGVIGLTKAAALEYAKEGIRVNAVCPGGTRTPMIEAGLNEPESEKQWRDMHPLGRVGEPEEIAEAVIWLCSDAASFITGHAMPVDGGWTAR